MDGRVPHHALQAVAPQALGGRFPSSIGKIGKGACRGVRAGMLGLPMAIYGH